MSFPGWVYSGAVTVGGITDNGGLTVAGNAVISGTAFMNGLTSLSVGSATAPSLTFTVATNTGLYLLSAVGSPAESGIGVTLNGVQVAQILDNGISLPSGSTYQINGVPIYKTVRSSSFAVTSGAISLPQTVSFSTPFADNNYTVQVTAVCAEIPTSPSVTSIVAIANVTLQAGGAGVVVYVTNADTLTHNVIIQVTAIHD